MWVRAGYWTLLFHTCWKNNLTSSSTELTLRGNWIGETTKTRQANKSKNRSERPKIGWEHGTQTWQTMSVLGRCIVCCRADRGEGGWARSGGGVQFERAYCRAGGSGWTLNDRGVSVWLGQRRWDNDEDLAGSDMKWLYVNHFSLAFFVVVLFVC